MLAGGHLPSRVQASEPFEELPDVRGHSGGRVRGGGRTHGGGGEFAQTKLMTAMLTPAAASRPMPRGCAEGLLRAAA